MNLTISDFDSNANPNASLLSHSIDTAEIMARFNQDVQIATGAAVEKALGYADTLSRQILSQLKSDLASVGKSKVMHIAVDGNAPRKLTHAANKALPRLIVNAKKGLHSLLVGPAGSGKTIAAMQLAESLGLPFSSVCFTSGASETWLFGRQTPTGFIEGPLPKAFRDGGVFLGDELDAADANMLLCINTMLANGVLYNPINGETMTQHANFVFIGGANTVGLGSNAVYTGRNRLDGSSLTRFVKIPVDYDLEIESVVCPDDDLREKLQAARATLRAEKLDYIVSTRCLDYAYRQKSAGISEKEIFESLTMGWPEDVVEKTNLKASRRKKSASSDDTGVPF